MVISEDGSVEWLSGGVDLADRGASNEAARNRFLSGGRNATARAHRPSLRNKSTNERGLSLRASSSGLFRGAGAFGSALAASDRARVL